MSCELLCGLLLEIETLCDKTCDIIDLVLQSSPVIRDHHHSMAQLYQMFVDNVNLLKLCRIWVVDLCAQYPIEVFYVTDSAILPLREHFCATYLNVNVVIDDADIMLLTLRWAIDNQQS